VSREIELALAAVRGCRHPTVAVIEGLCVGADLEIAACCDLRVCGESSRLGAPIGRQKGGGSFADLAPLAQLLGASPAYEALHGGDMMDAARARAFGLVSHVHPDTAVVEHAYRLAASVAAGAPLVNRWHKRVLQQLYERASTKDDAGG
jgi:enoyl-CoA hydratase/carnithine racemase